MKKITPLLLLALTGPAVLAQDASRQGRLVGVAQDPAGTRLAGVTIEVSPSPMAVATNDFWRQAPLPWRAVRRAKTNEQGLFDVPVAFGPLYEVKFQKPGYRSHTLHVYANRPFSGVLARGTEPTSDAPATKPKPFGIRGRILDEASGKPIAGAVLRTPWGHDALAQSDENGRFSVRWTEEAAKDLLLVITTGYQIAAIPKKSWAKDKWTEREVALKAGRVVEGRLLDEAGKPLAFHPVLIDSDIFVTPTHTYSGIAWRRTTDTSGRFRFAELAPEGRYWARTLLPDGTPLELGQGAAAEEPRDLGTLRTAPRTAVSGRVSWRPNTLIRDRDGKEHRVQGPLRDGRVHVLRLFEGKITQWLVARETPWYPIDANGLFRIPGLCPGKYELAFWAEGAEMEVRVVTAGDKAGAHRVDVTMGGGRRFSGRVHDEKGEPIDGALLRAMAWSKDEYFPLVPPDSPTGHNGRYLVGNVRVLTKPDGTYQLERIRSYLPIRLTVEKKGYSKATIRVEVDKEPPPVITLKRK